MPASRPSSPRPKPPNPFSLPQKASPALAFCFSPAVAFLSVIPSGNLLLYLPGESASLPAWGICFSTCPCPSWTISKRKLSFRASRGTCFSRAARPFSPTPHPFLSWYHVLVLVMRSGETRTPFTPPKFAGTSIPTLAYSTLSGTFFDHAPSRPDRSTSRPIRGDHLTPTRTGVLSMIDRLPRRASPAPLAPRPRPLRPLAALPLASLAQTRTGRAAPNPLPPRPRIRHRFHQQSRRPLHRLLQVRLRQLRRQPSHPLRPARRRPLLHPLQRQHPGAQRHPRPSTPRRRRRPHPRRAEDRRLLRRLHEHRRSSTRRASRPSSPCSIRSTPLTQARASPRLIGELQRYGVNVFFGYGEAAGLQRRHQADRRHRAGRPRPAREGLLPPHRRQGQASSATSTSPTSPRCSPSPANPAEQAQRDATNILAFETELAKASHRASPSARPREDVYHLQPIATFEAQLSRLQTSAASSKTPSTPRTSTRDQQRQPRVLARDDRRRPRHRHGHPPGLHALPPAHHLRAASCPSAFDDENFDFYGRISTASPTSAPAGSAAPPPSTARSAKPSARSTSTSTSPATARPRPSRWSTTSKPPWTSDIDTARLDAPRHQGPRQGKTRTPSPTRSATPTSGATTPSSPSRPTTPSATTCAPTPSRTIASSTRSASPSTTASGA